MKNIIITFYRSTSQGKNDVLKVSPAKNTSKKRPIAIKQNCKYTRKGGTDYTNQELDQWWDYEMMLEEDFRMLVQILNSSTSLRNDFCENQIDEYTASASSQFNKIKAKANGFVFSLLPVFLLTYVFGIPFLPFLPICFFIPCA